MFRGNVSYVIGHAHWTSATYFGINASPGQRVFFIDSHSVVISGLTFRNCSIIGEAGESGFDGDDVRGGAIINFSYLSLIDCVVSNSLLYYVLVMSTTVITFNSLIEAILSDRFKAALACIYRGLLKVAQSQFMILGSIFSVPRLH